MQEWILCKDKMPEEMYECGICETFGVKSVSNPVLVSLRPRGKNGVFWKGDADDVVRIETFAEGKILCNDIFTYGYIPIAWMPLPEPYKSEKM